MASRASTWPPPRESSPKRSHGSLLPWSGAADSAGFEPVVQPVQQHPVELSAVQVVHYFVSGGFELNDAPVPGTGAGEQLPAAGDAGDRVLGTVQDEQRQLQLACACKYFFAGDQQGMRAAGADATVMHERIGVRRSCVLRLPRRR